MQDAPKIGILGGSFDPPHHMHLELARAALEQLGLDEVIFVPAHRNPLKDKTAVASARQRLEMTRLLAAEDPRLTVSDIEIARGGPSYTVDTLADLQMARRADYYLIVGSDAAITLPNWRQVDKLLRMCRLAIAVRPPHTANEIARAIPHPYSDRYVLLSLDRSRTSSTAIREALRRRQSLHNELPESVAEYIERNGLYRSGS